MTREERVRSCLGLLPVVWALTLAACAPTVNSQSMPPRPVAPSAPVSAPAPPSPAAEAAVRVAILLPLSGPQAGLGQGLLNAAQLAVYDLAGPDFALLPQDTAGTPAGAGVALAQALGNGAQMVIGPVFSAEVEAIAAPARARSIPVIALSNNNGLASDGVYVLGQTPDDQVDRVLAFARTKGVARVAALLPASPYGAAVEEALHRSVAAQQMALVRVERVAPGADPALVAPAFAAAVTAAGGADAVLLGEGGARLAVLAGALRAAGLGARLLGTAVWDSAPDSTSPALAGGWYAAAPTQQRTAFAARYRQVYGSAPAPIATLAYDATALAAVLARHPSRFDRTRLLDPTGFSGLDGLFRLDAGGTTTRGLAVYELTTAGARVIDPAPTRFTPGM